MTTLRLLSCGLLVAFLAAGLVACAPESISDDSLAGDLASIHEAQAEERTALLPTALGAWQNARAATVGDPRQIADALAVIEDLLVVVNKKADEANAQVTAAQDALEAAQAAASDFEGVAHFASGGSWCGGNGCGGSCGDDCSFDKVCYEDHCRCIPTCGDKECGGDGCGGVCGDNLGACAGEQYCTADYKCADPTYRTDSCQPTCSRGGSPARAERRVKGQFRSHSVAGHQQRKNRPNFTAYGDLSDYMGNLGGQADDLKARQAGHLARAAQIETMKADVVAKAAAVKVARTAAADIAKDAKMADPTAGGGPSQAEVDAAKTAATDAAKAHKDASAALRKLEAKHRSEAGLMTRYGAAEARMRTEWTRVGAIASGWKAALDAVTAAEGALAAAKIAGQPAIDALEAEYSPPMDVSQKKIRDLQSPAFGDDLKVSWACGGPTCPTDAGLIRPDEALGLGPLVAAVANLHASRKAGLVKHLADLAAQKKADEAKAEAQKADGDEAEEAEADTARRLQEYPDWPVEVANLEAAAIHMDELAKANARTVGLRNALHEARSDLGE